jgi:hypothetical protein
MANIEADPEEDECSDLDEGAVSDFGVDDVT